MGVEVQTIRPGDGKTFPKAGDTVQTQYVLTLAADGRELDSSHRRHKPFEFQIGARQVIRGWDEGILKMSVGEKAKLIVTSDFGYGAEGGGTVIAPNSDLVFEVELLAILEPKGPRGQTLNLNP
mmetsp:Transcript_22733/g.35602  ORF Transcript_22733/g.35602 Transcript_22733/m.35602 type:complete len:124 (+) Transcript_22733:24-395(+)|eukprot:CAMPEP_0184298184 /NCGR_PEP_ID=MMETSP1049-20130417/9024_1 /TAXON_ID=77928 /ORGANISM="Proteomonas sulcata, Strain CCMP704" /LENGTH=123 /DNA_ID=CAMNT_0026608237 /DNA_START=24 /DNA_END=395 /DNA_ORIENTATION=-